MTTRDKALWFAKRFIKKTIGVVIFWVFLPRLFFALNYFSANGVTGLTAANAEPVLLLTAYAVAGVILGYNLYRENI
jgi:hypothetical protein